jgi:hypothetical protein
LRAASPRVTLKGGFGFERSKVVFFGDESAIIVSIVYTMLNFGRSRQVNVENVPLVDTRVIVLFDLKACTKKRNLVIR